MLFDILDNDTISVDKKIILSTDHLLFWLNRNCTKIPIAIIF